MSLGLVAAVVAALGYGIGSVLQARAAQVQRPAGDAPPSLRSTITTMLSAVFLLGVSLDGVAFAANLVADRELPLFLAQPIVSANLIVTAIAAGLFLGVVLSMRERAAIVAVIAALVALGAAAGPQGGPASGWAGAHHGLMHAGVLVVAGVLLLTGLVLLRVAAGTAVSAAAGLMAGALFGVMAVSIRIADGIEPFAVSKLLGDPAVYAVVLAGVGGFYLFTVALQTGSVNAAAAALVVGETVIPAAVGLAILGDQVRVGWWPVAAVAFLAAVGGAVTIALAGSAQLE
ncbi:membrane protein [Gordonia defluvii]|jgi:hypothetical protein|uniref:Membrane protein n=1 Tax=Gordonia defluvii TaxID=283718 RepID=A0ABP6LB41_9ACTN|nr:hypothetical protein [Gordonia sp. UBA5067]